MEIACEFLKGIVHFNVGVYQRAMKLLELVLKAREQMFVSDHGDTLSSK